jgi:hypothetical protein
VFLEDVGPQNQSQTWVDHLPSKIGRRHEFDLDLKFSQRWFKKKSKKYRKHAHGVMLCDILPRKNTKHGIPRFHKKTVHKKCHQAGVQLAFYPFDHDFQNQSETWFDHPPSKNGGRREFDLDLEFSQRWFKKNQKNRKHAHVVMPCDILPRKNIKYGIPRFHIKSLHKKCHQA